MIKILNTDVWGFEGAIRGMRNPHKTTSKSDSGWCDGRKSALCAHCPYCWREGNNRMCFMGGYSGENVYVLGKDDAKLAQDLVLAGTDHSKFMRMIHVQADITAPLYWWKEFDTYKVGTAANSESTMHTIAKKEFELSDFSTEHLSEDVIDDPFMRVIECLNFHRSIYLHQKDKEDWYTMIQLLPTNYNQTRTVDLNYQVLSAMYHARKHHKLDEWRDFCNWIRKLPLPFLIAGYDMYEACPPYASGSGRFPILEPEPEPDPEIV